ncbi:hypothetical protein [Streptomyces sedi]|uniref:SPOR domain-containing protein n=1 Tax=Streptomyces sedi TaxID=555059 RepID=A0A5C4V5G4_9ACTN|nr:hypothetical protein [Streptomyces sedi]TNM31144.1 hypothetical protein FH715_10685 [Streptomyces sedi]
MALFKRKADTTADDDQWYYCLRHQTVEQGLQCPGKDRMGPYATREEAARALETARDRDEHWREDPRWNDAPDRRGRPEGDDPGPW